MDPTLELSWAQSQWDKVLEFFGNDDFNLRVWGTFLVSMSVYWGVGVFFTFVDITGSPKFILKYKVQENFKSYPLSHNQVLDLIQVVLTNQFLSLPLAILSFYSDQRRGIPVVRELPDISTCILHWISFFVIREITFYYSHRLLHHPSIYKSIHKKHHTWISPVAISAAYCHPVEHIVSNVLPIVLGPALLKSHTILLWLYIALSTVETLTVHSGFHLPFFASPEFHDFHHLKFNYNYGFLGIMDYLHQTDSLFRKSKQSLRHKRFWTLTPPKVLIPDGKD